MGTKQRVARNLLSAFCGRRSWCAIASLPYGCHHCALQHPGMPGWPGCRQHRSKESLDVSHNHFGNAGLEAILKRASQTLHTLRLRDNSLNGAGVAVLTNSPASNTLMELDLADNGLTSASRRALGTTDQLQRLLVLHAGDNRQLGYKPLALSPLGQRLKLLNVEQADPWYEGYLPPDETMPYFDAYTESEDDDEDWDDDEWDDDDDE